MFLKFEVLNTLIFVVFLYYDDHLHSVVLFAEIVYILMPLRYSNFVSIIILFFKHIGLSFCCDFVSFHQSVSASPFG